MIKLFRVVLFIVCVLGTSPVMGADAAAESGAAQTENFDWEPVIKAIVQVESEGNTRAVKGNSCGAMQITPILVAECNNILKKRKSKKRYTLRDRFSLEKSKEMFLLMQSHFNPLNDIEKAIRSWNGGNKYSVKRTQRYFEKVMKCIQSQK
ncbi:MULTISPECIES: transglycosylase SLT domain-containing protein [Prevotella]|uniref:transglycosylase SLT domain-containing protein n=1 Tax=Prevotella TaxID=838 RepID=UPI0027E33C2F|nr:transglycosylase SLT domain-containing protein [Prevotella sp.]